MVKRKIQHGVHIIGKGLLHITCLISWKDTTRLIPNVFSKIIYSDTKHNLYDEVKIILLHKEIITYALYESKSKFSKIYLLYLIHYLIQQLY